MATNRAAIRKQLEEGLNAIFGETYRNLPEEWPMVFDRETSSKAFEEVATSYQALLTKMETAAATTGAKINSLLYEGFVERLKRDLTDEVNRS